MAMIKIKNTSTSAAVGPINNLYWAPGETRSFQFIDQFVKAELDRVGTTLKDVTKAGASLEAITPIKGSENVITVQLTVDTAIYAAGEVMSAVQEIPAVYNDGRNVVALHSITVLDKDKRSQPFDILFFDSLAAMGGALNAAVNISDADAEKIVAIVSVLAGDYVDLVNSSIAIKSNVGQVIEVPEGTTSLWMATIARGTPTYTNAANIKIKLGFI